MKTAEKLAGGWLLTLGFMMLTISTSAVINRMAMYKQVPPGVYEEQDFVNHDAVYQLETTALNGVIFGVPSLVLGGWLSLGMYSKSKKDKKAIAQQMDEQLQSTFYRIIQENNGRITLLSFAMQSQLPPAKAKEYLDSQAKIFSANFKVSEEGSVSYHFDI